MDYDEIEGKMKVGTRISGKQQSGCWKMVYCRLKKLQNIQDL